MQGNFGKDDLGRRRGDHLPIELEADWSYLRANLDLPAHRIGNRLGSGLTAWLFRHLHTASTPAPQLSILARISLGPRQSVALVEAEGVRLLVGTSADGPPSFYPLAGCSGVNPDRDSDRAASAMQESESSHGDARDRMPAGSVAIGSNGGARTTSRMRLTGRVSWV